MTPPALRSTPLTASLPCLPSWSSSKARPGRSARFRSIPSQRREEPIRHHRGCRGTHLHVSGRRGSGIARGGGGGQRRCRCPADLKREGEYHGSHGGGGSVLH